MLINKRGRSISYFILTCCLDNLTLNEQIAMHKLKHENAVFASKTSRSNKLSHAPGPGEYNTMYEHTYIKNNPEGFGSTTNRMYMEQMVGNNKK